MNRLRLEGQALTTQLAESPTQIFVWACMLISAPDCTFGPLPSIKLTSPPVARLATILDPAVSRCLNQSMSDASLEPAHDAVAKVFCDVEGRHLVQVGITDFFGDLLGPSYAVVFAVDHDLISVGRAFRQHRFVDALDRNAKFRIV